MRQSLMKLVDKNQDGVIDYGEHMDYINSSKAATDNGWEACYIIFSVWVAEINFSSMSYTFFCIIVLPMVDYVFHHNQSVSS